MLITQMIKRLEELKEKHGDIACYADDVDEGMAGQVKSAEYKNITVYCDISKRYAEVDAVYIK